MKTLQDLSIKNSTNVLLLEREKMLPLSIGLAASALGWIAPTVVADKINKKFMTPNPYNMKPDEIAILKNGHPFKVRTEGEDIQAWSWGDGPTILLVHGWSGVGAQFFKFIPELTKAGFSVVTFDGVGHGQSSGQSTNLPAYSRVVKEVANQIGISGIVAHSFGSLVTSFSFSLGLKQVPAVFLSAPSESKYFFDKFLEHFGVSEFLKSLASDRLTQSVGYQWPQLKVSSFAEKFEAHLKIFQDPAETNVPWSQALEVHKNWKNSELKSVPGVGHYRILRSAEVIQESVEFFQKNVSVARDGI